MDIAPRPLTDDERAVLDLLLSESFSGVEHLREQVGRLQVVGRCDCGCPTIYFRDPPDMPSDAVTHPAPVEGRVENADPSADVLLFVRNGALSTLEYVCYGDNAPDSWPPADQITPVLRSE